MKLIAGTAHIQLAERIATCVGQPLVETNLVRFPDGEIHVKILENVRGSDVFIIQPTCRQPNESIMELLIMIDALRRASAARITAVLPYYGYGRQDRKDQPRVPITAKLVANLLVAAGVSRMLTMDLHAQQIQGFFDIPVDHLYAAPVLVKHLRTMDFKDLVVVSPDPGGLKMAHAYSNMLESGLAIVAKQRISATEVDIVNVVGDVEGRDCVLVDDMSTTAGTLCGGAKILKERGAAKVMAAVTHAMFTDQGIKRLQDSDIDQVLTTDSVPARDYGMLDVTVLSVAELLANAILRIHNNQSVTSLFRV